MAPRRRTKSTSPSRDDASDGQPLLLVDAGMAAGWRRAEPDLDQLDEVVEAARAVVPDVVVLGDASLKWSLPDSQQEKFEQYRATATVLCAPGGTTGGHHEFLKTAARAAASRGRDVYILSALALGDGPWRLAMVRRPEGRWTIELAD
ncbi:hypothetical protein [Actinospongicola halichondriae]|uniref:hypothetical protein n=1 Tax=Actinospongicola halichondriae TaxID=3236844 RepID=UPI003D4DB51E